MTKELLEIKLNGKASRQPLILASIDRGISKSIWRWLTSLASRLLTASCEVEEGTQATTGKRKSKRGWFKGTDRERAIGHHTNWVIGTVFVALNLWA
jgi:hypothetical protein